EPAVDHLDNTPQQAAKGAHGEADAKAEQQNVQRGDGELLLHQPGQHRQQGRAAGDAVHHPHQYRLVIRQPAATVVAVVKVGVGRQAVVAVVADTDVPVAQLVNDG